MRKADRLRLWAKSGWTYRGLAEATGFDHQTLRRTMLGVTRLPRPEVAEVLARAVSKPGREVTADELFVVRQKYLGSEAA